MSEISMNEQECQRDMLCRIHKWLDMLEERIVLLLHAHEPQELKASECEQAITRHLVLLLRLMHLRQQHAASIPTPGEQALLDALLRGIDEDERV